MFPPGWLSHGTMPLAAWVYGSMWEYVDSEETLIAKGLVYLEVSVSIRTYVR
jgi:hypothetical protein